MTLTVSLVAALLLFQPTLSRDGAPHAPFGGRRARDVGESTNMADSFAGALETAMSASTESAATPAETTASAPTAAASGVSPDAGAATTGQAAEAGKEQAAATQAQPVDQQGKKGPIPFDVHETTLKNAREKTKAETEAAYKWATSVPEKHRPIVGQFYALMDRDPVQAIDLLIQQANADEQHAPRLRSYFGRMLGASRRPGNEGAAAVDLDADFFGTSQDGQQVPLFSADKVKALVAHEVRQALSQVDQKLSPYEQDRKARESQAKSDAAKKAADDEADALYGRISKWQGFTEHEKDIAAVMQADDSLDVYEAYQRVVIPKLGQQAKVQVVADMKDKSAASGLNPNAATAAAKRPASFEEAFAALPAGAWGG